MTLSSLRRECGAVLSFGVTLVISVAATIGCTCQDTEPGTAPRAVKLTSEQQQALNVDRVRFKLNAPEDYAKEAYLAIDEDNVQAEFEKVRREIEAEVAAPSAVATGVSSSVSGNTSSTVATGVSSGATPGVSP